MGWWMVSPDKSKRPTTNEILSHPLFWDSTKRLKFLDRVNSSSLSKSVTLKNQIKASSSTLNKYHSFMMATSEGNVPIDWRLKLPDPMKNEIFSGKKPRYDN